MEERLYEVGHKVGELAARVDALREEGRASRRAVESLTDEVRRLLERQDQRLDALEARLAAQEAEGRGMRRAFGWSASALGMAGAAVGWLLSRGGDWIAALFGPGGTGGGR